MAKYTYFGNRQESTNGASVIIVESGVIKIGESGELTDEEYEFFSPILDIRPGAVEWERETVFPWQKSDYSFVLIDCGSALSTDTVVLDGSDSSTSDQDQKLFYDCGDSSRELVII